jgi:hypothetical protein
VDRIKTGGAIMLPYLAVPALYEGLAGETPCLFLSSLAFDPNRINKQFPNAKPKKVYLSTSVVVKPTKPDRTPTCLLGRLNHL